jgi:hypothetical protein
MIIRVYYDRESTLAKLDAASSRVYLGEGEEPEAASVTASHHFSFTD